MGGMINVVGLGSGAKHELAEPYLRDLKMVGRLYLRTADFPLVSFLQAEGIEVISFDHVYERHGGFEEVYEEIVQRLISLAKEGGPIFYGVPGHPRVAERTVSLLMDTAREHSVDVKILGGHSFLDQVFIAFNFDPIEGFSLLDGTSLHVNQLNPLQHTVVAQVYDQFTASDVKLTLMELYPDEMLVWAGSYLGTDQEKIEQLPLYAIDQHMSWNNFSLLYVPPARDDQILQRRFSYVRDLVDVLRSPEGCPWDREQTHQSIRKNLIEETYEVLEAIDLEDVDSLQEELGDLLLQILLHSQMAKEVGYFDIHDVIAGLSEKLIRRHPHVFGDQQATNEQEALFIWQDMKDKEKQKLSKDQLQPSVLSGIPKDLPAILRAYKLQIKAGKVGFDWDHVTDVQAKVEEEWSELCQAETNRAKKEELGDLLFSIVNLARFLNIDPEEALAQTNLKFIQRFNHIEESLRAMGKNFEHMSIEELEALWQKAKKVTDHN